MQLRQIDRANEDNLDIRELLRPEAFTHSVEKIELRETHISWVVRTGPFAYKIKKPVKLDFIDAATLQRRRFLCEEELRLNQRLAPDVYIDVVRIVRTQAGLLVGGRGQVVDYAVRIARATREWPGISVGAGPRGSLSLIRAARAQAVLDSRDFVTPDDVRTVAKPSLRHRVSLAPEMQIEGRRIDDVLEALLSKVEAPRK